MIKRKNNLQYTTFTADHYDSRGKEKVAFFRSIPLLMDWPQHALSAILRDSKLIKFSHGQTIFKQGDEVNEVYFVKQGDIEVLLHIMDWFFN